jgi:hypothetical protein
MCWCGVLEVEFPDCSKKQATAVSQPLASGGGTSALMGQSKGIGKRVVTRKHAFYAFYD